MAELALFRDLAAETVERMPLGLVALDQEMRVTYANEVALELIGVSLAELVNRRPWDLFPQVVGTRAHMVRRSAAITVEYVEQVGPGGHWVGVLGCPIQTGTAVFLRDIAAHTRAEETVRRSVALTHGSLDPLRDAFMLCAAVRDETDAIVDFRVDFANGIAGAFMREVPDALLGALTSAMTPDWAANLGQKSFLDVCREVIETGEAWADDAVGFALPGLGGASTHGTLSIQIARYNDGFFATWRDVTRERASEAIREHLARERALIAGALADLRVLPTPTATAETICRQVLDLTGVASASLSYFTLEGPVIALAFMRADGVPVALRRLPYQRSRVLRQRAEEGPWVEGWVHRPWHPYDRLHGQLGTRALAYAPVLTGGRLIGILTVSSAEADAVLQLTESLPALLDFAGFAGALVGPSIASLTEFHEVHERIADMVRTAAFWPVFQPIVDLTTGAHAGYEALTRFSSGTSPDLVFADARAAGLETDLETATLEAAISAAANLPPGAWLSLNVSPGLVTGNGGLARLLQKADRPVVLEVTEHVPVTDYVALRAAIGRLQPEVKIAVDDAGAGVANFAHIVELRPAFVKLDIGLVRGIDADLSRQALMVGLLHFATESASTTIAEGVETEAELSTLRRLGVPFAQGYLLGRPAPVDEWVEGTGSPARRVVGDPRGEIASDSWAAQVPRSPERQLAQMEARYRGLLEAAPDAMVVVDQRGAIVLLNVQAEKQFGYSRDELVGQPVTNIIPEGFAERIIADDLRSAADALAQQIGTGIELVALRKDGTEFPIEIMLSPLESAEGILVTAAIRDITDRRRADEEMRASQERVRRFFDANIIGLFIAGPTGVLQEANDYFLGLVGHTRAELDRGELDWLAMTAPESRRSSDAAVREMQERGRASYEKEYLRPDGTRVPVLVADTLLPGPDQLVAGFVLDISDRKAAEGRMAQMEARYRGLLEAAPDAMVVVDQRGAIVLLNVQAEKQFGYSRDELVGQPVTNIIPEGFAERIIADDLRSAADALAQQIGTGIELVALRKDGTEFPIEIMLSPLESAEGILVTAAIRDITDRKAAAAALLRKIEELARSNEELGQFAYIASHDLQEPLRMVASYTQLLSRRYTDKLDSDANEFIAFAVDGASRMQQMIEDLLAYSRVGTKGSEMLDTSSEKALGHALANLRGSIEESGALVTHDRLPTVLADETQLVQLFQNLVGNAIKYRGPQAPRVHVSAASDGAKRWTFGVTDNGIGIDPQYFERIFVMFQRLHGRAEHPGTGIGLAICKKIVERHGGTISVESQPGRGSTFRFTLAETRSTQ